MAILLLSKNVKRSDRTTSIGSGLVFLYVAKNVLVPSHYINHVRFVLTVLGRGLM